MKQIKVIVDNPTGNPSSGGSSNSSSSNEKWKQSEMKILSFLATLFVTLFSLPASAAVFHLNDASTYNAIASDASAISLPNLGAPVSNQFDAGGLTFGTTAPLGILSGTGAQAQWSTLLNGPEIAISGREDFGLAGNNLKSLSFEIHEPTVNGSQTNFTDTCNAPCVNSAFRVSVFANGSQLNVIEFGLGAAGPLTFLGITSDVAFDTVIIREVVGTADNEFFGNFTVSRFDTPATVPLPASISLGMLGLLSLAGIRCWKKRLLA